MSPAPAQRPSSRRLGLALAAAAAGTLALATPAMADSIVYIDGGNVWSGAPDGSRKVQLTSGGDWHSPTQSDDGTIAAVAGTGNLISLFTRDGQLLHTIATQPARSADGGTFAPRPVMLSLSPDGSKLAYSYAEWSCPVASTCGSVQRSTFYTYTNVTEATPQSLFGEQFSVSDPEWVTNDRALVFGGFGTGVSIDDLAGGGDSSFTHWIPRPVKDMGDGEVSRNGQRLAIVSDYGANANIGFYAVVGNAAGDNPPPLPLPACNTSKDAAMSDPTWSPDSSSVAFHTADGIDVVHFSELGDNHCASTVTTFGGGSEPDWGPADPPAARASTPPPAGTVPAPKPGGSGGPAGGAGGSGGPIAGGTLALRPRTLTTSALRRGTATVRVDVGHAGRVTVRLSAGSTTIATGSAKATKAGTIRVRLSKASRRGLAALRGRGNAGVTLRLSAKGQERLEGSGTVKVH